MKKLLMLVGFYLALSYQINAQSNASEIREVNEITWYGLDFSNVRLIGAIGFKNPEKIKSYYFDAYLYSSIVIPVKTHSGPNCKSSVTF